LIIGGKIFLKFVNKIKTKTYFLWGTIFLLALFVRVFRLEEIPYGFHVDEAKAGWNAYSILATGADDRDNILSLYYDSFGDFRPTGMFYMIIPSLLIFGRSVFSVRFPFALIGALTIFPTIFILKELSKKYVKVGVAASIFIALNPWHIMASRATSESVVSIFLTLWGIYFLLKTFRRKSRSDFLWSILFFILSYFFYHSIRVLAPLFVLVIVFVKRSYPKEKNNYFRPMLIFIILSLTTLLFMSGKEARGRMSQVSLKSDFKVLYEVTKMPTEEGPGHVLRARIFHNRIASYIRRFAEEYKEYFGTSFLLGEAAKPIRYSVPYVGLLTYFEFLLFILGLFWVSKKKEMLVILALLVLAPIPAAVTIEDTPNLQRAIYMIPFLAMIAAYGVYGLLGLEKKWRFLLYLIGFGYLLNFVYFLHMYFIHQKMSIASYYRNGANVELVKRLGEIRGDYKEIILTNSPDDLYPWVGFLGGYEASKFNQAYREERRVENFVFSNDKCPLNSALGKDIDTWEGVLFVEAEGCVPEERFKSLVEVQTVETIFRPDNSPPYYLRTVEMFDERN
jgi:4-amino-4-deoxy-L-arabinose transferase-like glycosyltransferase